MQNPYPKLKELELGEFFLLGNQTVRDNKLYMKLTDDVNKEPITDGDGYSVNAAVFGLTGTGRKGTELLFIDLDTPVTRIRVEASWSVYHDTIGL